MRRVVTYCMLISLVLATMTGCGIGKGKYVGKYVFEQGGSVLELKSDGTYRYETEGFLGHVTTGEWSVEKDDGDEIVSLLGGGLGEPSAFKRSRQTGNLIGILGETFVKQDFSASKDRNLVDKSSTKKTVVGKSIDTAKAAQCREQLDQIRKGIETYKAASGSEQNPATFKDIGLGVSNTYYRCPVSNAAYTYDPATGKVACPAHPDF